MGTDKMILRHVYDKYFAITFSNRSEWKYRIQINRKEEHVWYTDGFKTNEGNGTGVYGSSTRKVSFSLGQYTTAFQACAVENLDASYRNRNLYILSEIKLQLQHLAPTR
jgi:hypothetical protein